MLLFPGGISPLGYIVAVPAVFLLAMGAMRLWFFACMKQLRCEALTFCRHNGIGRRWKLAAVGAAMAFLIFIVFWSNFVSCYHMDMSEYILAGDYFARIRDVTYHGRIIDPTNGFWLHAYHSYCLPLFATWGVFTRQFFGGQEDWYYRFVMLYYWGGLNLVAATFLIRRKMNAVRWLAAGTAFLVLNTMPFMWRKVPFVFNCDLVRVSLIMAAVSVLWRHLCRPQWGTCLFLGILGSAAIAAHGTSVFFVAILYSTLLFAQATWKTRMRQALVVGLVVLATWGMHYVFQTAFGDGWIFADGVGETVCSEPNVADVDTHGKIAALTWSIFLNFPYWAEFFAKGCLGQVFDISHFSTVFVFVLCGAWLLARKIPKLPGRHQMVLAACAAIYFIIAFWLNSNFRYRFTLVPLMIVVSIRLLMDEPSLVGRMTRKAWIALWLAILVAPFVLTSVLMDSKMATERSSFVPAAVVASPGTCSRADGWVGRVRGLVVGRLRPPRPIPPWPESGIGAPPPRVVFTDVSKIMYRSAPFPVWYCDKRSVLVGPRGPCSLGNARLAEAFDYFVLREGMRPDFLPECFHGEDWCLIGRGNGCALYRSRLRSGVDDAVRCEMR